MLDDPYDPLEELKQRIFDEAEWLGQQMLFDLVESVSVPVAFEGSRVVRSLPGEPPRLETGLYASTLQYESIIDIEGGKFRISLFTDDERGIWFEEGTDNMAPRPHFDAITEKWADTVVSHMQYIASGQ